MGGSPFNRSPPFPRLRAERSLVGTCNYANPQGKDNPREEKFLNRGGLKTMRACQAYN